MSSTLSEQFNVRTLPHLLMYYRVDIELKPTWKWPIRVAAEVLLMNKKFTDLKTAITISITNYENQISP